MERNSFEVVKRQIGLSTTFSVVVTKGKIRIQGCEKVVPLTLVYNQDGTYTTIDAHKILADFKPIQYKSYSKDFSQDRITSANYSRMMDLFSNYPTLPTEIVNGVKTPHPLAEVIYGSYVLQQPSVEFASYLSSLSIFEANKAQSIALDLLSRKFFEDTGMKLDQYSVPKRDVGGFSYVSDHSGIGHTPKYFSLGFHLAIPSSRIARELSQIKNLERFTNPVPIDRHVIPNKLKPFTTALRVAFIWTESSMLDSGDLYPSSVAKLACVLERKTETRDLSLIPPAKQNLTPRIFYGGIELVHEEVKYFNEMEEGFTTLKLLTIGGVKFAAQLQTDVQAYCEGQEVDLVLDMRTAASKGAIALLSSLDPGCDGKNNPTLEDCKRIFESMKTKEVKIGDKTYLGYVGEAPFFRTRQRALELSKPSNNIATDLISLACLGQELVPSPEVSTDYAELKKFVKTLEDIQTSLATT